MLSVVTYRFSSKILKILDVIDLYYWNSYMLRRFCAGILTEMGGGEFQCSVPRMCKSPEYDKSVSTAL